MLSDIHRRTRLIRFLIVGAAALLSAILILGSIPNFRYSSYGTILFPGAVVIGLIIAGLSMYVNYASHYRLESFHSDNLRLLNETIRWDRPAFVEPYQLYRDDFKQLKKLLQCKRGVLYIYEKGRHTPVAFFGLKLSEIRPFVFQGEMESRVDKSAFPSGAGLFTGMSGISDDFRRAVGWNSQWIIRFDSPGGVSATAVFSAVPRSSLKELHEEILRILINRISLELDYTVSRFGCRSLRKKCAELFNENINLKKEFRRKVYDIHSLFKESSNLYTILNEEKLLNSFLLMIMGQLGLKKAAIFRFDQEGGLYHAKYGRGIAEEVIRSLVLNPEGAVISGLSALDGPGTLVELKVPTGNDDEMAALMKSGFQAYCKLMAGGLTYGYLFTGEKLNDNKYLQTDLKLMSILVNMMTSALENINNYRIIEELSFTDSMTGLYNYRYFYKRLNEELFRSRRYYRNLALAIFDIDDFKVFNDTYGHQAGDTVLRQIGTYLRELVRATDVVCRYGGEEFCIIMQETDLGEVRASIERLRKKIESYEFESEYSEKTQKVTVSIGAAVYPSDAETADKLIYCADMAMLKAKSEGKNLSNLYSDLNLPAENWNKKFRTRKE